jgi:thioredoxin 1
MKILKFYADWCGPCKMLSKTIESIKEEIPFEVEEIDADNNAEMAKKYNIRGLPTMVIVDGEAEVKRHVGNMTADQVKEFVKVK